MLQKRGQDKDQFELLLVEFVDVGRRANDLAAIDGTHRADEHAALRSEARRILNELVNRCQEMDATNEWRPLLAIALIAASAKGSDLLGFDLLELMDRILPN